MRGWIVGVGVALAACQAPVSVGAVCIRTSECDESLVCATGVCRTQCGDSRDCVNAASCVTYHGSGICVPPTTPVPCIFNTDCGALFCRNGQCVAQCTTDHDCDAGSCLNSFCTRPAMTPAMPGDAGPATGDGGVCPSGLVQCGTDLPCTDLATDAMNCGSCSHECPTNERCAGGQCLCDAPRTTCGIECIDTTSDVANCGGCGVSCSGGRCSAGHCCPTGQIYCGGVCVDASVDGNCGACGVTCMVGWNCRESGCRGPGDTCASPMDHVVVDGRQTFPPGGLVAAEYVDDVSCSFSGPDVFVRLSAAERTITLVDPNDQRWTPMPTTCDATGVVCANADCGGPGAGVLEVIDTTPRLYEVEMHDSSGTDFDVYAVPIGDLPAARLPAVPFATTVSGPWGTTGTGCGPAAGASVVYALDCAMGTTNMLMDVTVRACDPTGAPVSLAVRRHGDAAVCGSPDLACPGGLVATVSMTGGYLPDAFFVVLVGHVSASDTGPITLTATVP